MKKGLLFFLLSVCYFFPVSFATEQYNFIHINGVNGLSNSHVKSIIQDSYGFIWLGTRNGLNRYDGVSMQVYPCFGAWQSGDLRPIRGRTAPTLGGNGQRSLYSGFIDRKVLLF